MAHRTTYVMQGSISNPTHLIEGFIDGLNARRPALFNVYSPCLPEHGIGDDLAEHQSKLAVESRAYPLFRYNPDKGILPEECFDLEGNPALDTDWPTYTLDYVDEKGKHGKIDTAHDLRRFRRHRRPLPQAVPHRAARHLERQHGAAGGVPGTRCRTTAKENSPTSGR